MPPLVAGMDELPFNRPLCFDTAVPASERM
jgi:hypothetical protein